MAQLRFQRIWGMVLIMATLLFGCPFGVSAAEGAEIFTATELKVLDEVDPAFITEQMEYIHNNIGPRFAGTPGDEDSAAYFADIFMELGYVPFFMATDSGDSYFQSFEDDWVNDFIGGSVTIGGRTYSAVGPWWDENSIYCGYERPSVNGETVYFENVDDIEIAAADILADKIILTNAKPEWFGAQATTEYTDVARMLEGKGAAAVVFFDAKYTVYENGGTSGGMLVLDMTGGETDEQVNIPVVLVPYLESRSILKSMTVEGEVQSVQATVVNRRNTHTGNILAVKEAVEPTDKYVMVGAHRDSELGVEGANDNLSGTVSALAIANALKDVPTRYNVIFALWGAEEFGLYGSRYFNNQVLAPDNWGIEHIIAYYNIDMSASSQAGNSVLSAFSRFEDPVSKELLQTAAADVAEAQANRYYSYTNGMFDAWWIRGQDGELVELRYPSGFTSDHEAIIGSASNHWEAELGESIPSVWITWVDPARTSLDVNIHGVGDIYVWPEDEDQFYVLEAEHPFAGNFSIERSQILTRVYALAVYNTAAAPVEGIRDKGVYYGDTSFTVSYNYRDGVMLDGNAVELNKDGTFIISADDMTHIITFADAFENEDSYTVTVCRTGGSSDSTEEPDQGPAVISPKGSVSEPAATFKFTDVKQGSYCYDAVNWATKNNITFGTSETKFSPDVKCSRAQSIIFLWRAAGCPEPKTCSSFSDVSADGYYGKAIAWAAEKGIAAGTGNDKFEPDALCTRGQAVTFLWRAIGSPNNADNGSAFTDVKQGSYCERAVNWAVENKVAFGTAAAFFSPDSVCTRGQVVTFLYRISH